MNNNELTNNHFGELLRIGTEHQTDKVTHGFLPYYENLLGHLKTEKINFLEIGVFFGASIKMWKDYFTNGEIYGMDTFEGLQGNGNIFPNPTLFYDNWKTGNIDRVKLFKCDQSKEIELYNFVKYCEDNNILFDVILDDASHLMRDQQITLSILFKLLKKGGYFIVEDIHSSDTYPGYDVVSDFSNTTKNVLFKFKETKKFVSPYVDNKEIIDYLESTVDKIEYFIAPNNESQVIILKKK